MIVGFFRVLESMYWIVWGFRVNVLTTCAVETTNMILKCNGSVLKPCNGDWETKNKNVENK